MAAILSVTYTPAYSGCHRICFKTSQASYCCYQDNSPSQPGTQKITDIDLDDYAECLVDLPLEVGCEGGSNVDGYVQPCCTDAVSLENRVPFTAVFSTVPCNSYRVECEESGVGEIQIINAGYGWPIGVTPTIIVNTTGSGSGFVATATMNCLPGDNFCSIDDIDITDPGLEYFYINELSVTVSPLPTCISNELVIDGSFSNGLADWTVGPFSNSFVMSGSYARYNIATVPSGGTISQNILDPGKTYDINIGNATVGSTDGIVRLIITAGSFDNTGTAPNQYMIVRDTNDPQFNAPINITLTCSGSSAFSIYADSVIGEAQNRIQVRDISVVEVCTAVNPELDVISLDGCGTFTVPECNGGTNPTQYDIFGTPEYAINVCSGGAGPVAGVGGKYNITPNPTYQEPGPELVVNGGFTTNINNWNFYNPGDGFAVWSPSYGGSALWNPIDVNIGLYQDILTVGQTYTVNVSLVIIPNANPACIPFEDSQVAFDIYAGTARYGPLTFSGQQDFTFNITCTGNTQFRIECIDPNACATALYCSYASVRELGPPIPVSCCDCFQYNIVVRNPIDIYYTDCDQNIVTASVEAGAGGLTICGVLDSIFPVIKTDNSEILAITNLGSCP